MTSIDALELQRAELLANREVVTPHWVIGKKNARLMRNVHCVYAVALLRGHGREGVFYPGATQWTSHKQDEAVAWPMVAAQLLMLAMENSKLGAPCIDVCKEANPGAYERTLQAFARVSTGRNVKKEDRDIVAKNVVGSHGFSISMQKDISDAVEALVPAAAAGAAPVQQQQQQPERPRPLEDRIQPFVRNGGHATPGTRFEHMTAAQLSGRVTLSEAPASAAAVADGAGVNDADGDFYPKAEMTMTPLANDAGYLMQVHVYDPSWNPGSEIRNLIQAERQRQMPSRFFKDAYEQYAPFRASAFPAFGFTWDKYVRLCSHFLPEPLDAATLEYQMIYGRPDDFSAMLHPSRVFTLANALRHIREAGKCPAALCNNTALYRNAEAKTSCWPAAYGNNVYHYPIDTVMWYHPIYAGLSFQYLPDNQARSTEQQHGQRLLELAAANALRDDDQADARQLLAEMQEAAALPDGGGDGASAQRLIHTAQVRAEKRIRLEFPTPNEFDLGAMEARDMESRLKEARPTHLYDTLVAVQEAKRRREWPHLISQELAGRVAEANAYLSLVKRERRVCMDRFSNLCQLEGDVSSVPISKTMRVMLEWYRDKVGRRGLVFSRGMRLFDPDLSFFGNGILRKQTQLDRVCGLIQPVIQILAEGLFYVYAYDPSTLCLNVMLHGPAAAGKTHTLNNTMEKVTCIPGTLSHETRSTNMADLTDTHIDDEIRLRDEVEQWMVDPIAAAKEPDKVNRLKQAMTNRMLFTKVFADLIMANGEKRRSSRYVTTKQNYAQANTTNYVFSDQTPLSSRYHARTMISLDVSAEEFNFEVSDVIKADCSLYFHKLQFCSAWMYKCAMMGAIAQRPFTMTVWKDVTLRMNQYWKRVGVQIDQNMWKRAQDKMVPVVKQMIVNQAQVLTFDLPSSPHYGKEFRPHMLEDMAPHLYCTQEIVLFVTTLMADEIIKDDFANVLRAMLKLFGVDWSPDFSPFDYATRSADLPFQFVANRGQSGQSGGASLRRSAMSGGSSNVGGEGGGAEKDRFCVNLNKMELRGSKQSLAMRISAETNPHIGAGDVLGILTQLTKILHEPVVGSTRRYGYAPIPSDTFKQRYARRKAPRHHLVLGAFASSLVDQYAQRYFRRTITSLPAFQSNVTDWSHLHTAAGLSSEEILRLHALSAAGTVPPALSVLDAGNWLRSGAVPPPALDDDELLRIGHALVPPVTTSAAAVREALGNSWALARAMIMAIDDEMFYSPESTNRSAHYYERVCHGWEGDYRECDVPDLNNGQTNSDGTPKTSREKVPVVEMVPQQNDTIKLLFHPGATGCFDKQIIVDGFLYATMCDSFPPQKYILGWANDMEPTKFDVLHITERIRDDLVTRLVSQGPHESYRREGIRMARMGYINACEDEILFSTPINGVGMSNEFRKHARHEVESRSQMVEIISSMDDRAAFQQHLLAGRPLDEPVQTPSVRREQYLAAWNPSQQGGFPALGNVNYPIDLIRHGDAQRTEWAGAVPAKSAVPHFDDIRSQKQRKERQTVAIQRSDNRKRANDAPTIVSQEERPLQRARPTAERLDDILGL